MSFVTCWSFSSSLDLIARWIPRNRPPTHFVSPHCFPSYLPTKSLLIAKKSDNWNLNFQIALTSSCLILSWIKFGLLFPLPARPDLRRRENSIIQKLYQISFGPRFIACACRRAGGFWKILIFPPSQPKKSSAHCCSRSLERKTTQLFCRSQRLEFNNTLGWAKFFFSFTFKIYYLCIHDAFFVTFFLSSLLRWWRRNFRFD